MTDIDLSDTSAKTMRLHSAYTFQNHNVCTLKYLSFVFLKQMSVFGHCGAESDT